VVAGLLSSQSPIEFQPDLIVVNVRTQAEVDEKGVIEANNFHHIPLEELVGCKAE
jgi:rhodanese-related sulfurtransferase